MDNMRIFQVAQEIAAGLPQTRENMRIRGLVEQLTSLTETADDPFVYALNIAALAPAAQAQANILIENDADFECLAGGYMASVANAGQTEATRTYPLLTVQIRNTGTGRNFFNIPVPVVDVFGNGELPFLWPVPKLMKMRSLFEFTVTNFDAAQTYTNIFLCLIGVKKFSYAQG